MTTMLPGAARAALTLACLTLVAGCVSTPPRPEFASGSRSIHLQPSDSASIRVEPDNGVVMLPYEKERMVEEITEILHAKQALGVAELDPRHYEVDITITRYEKGNAFARAMLAGLGQIHIDGRVDLYALPDHTRICEFTLSKTFAWGGIYGASTSIEDVERSFSEGVANALTGHENGVDAAGAN